MTRINWFLTSKLTLSRFIAALFASMPASLLPPAPLLLPDSETHSAQSLLPRNPGFAGHQTFALRAGWLKKGLDALEEKPQIFAGDEALVTLGVGKNMVGAIRHWLLATGMAGAAGRDLVPTPLGQSLFREDGFDPYLEDPATLWILHWKLCGPGSECFTWAWAFNFLREWEWSREKLVDELVAAAGRSGKAPSRETVERDAGVFLATYFEGERAGQNSEDGLDCPLRELGLIRPAFERHLRWSVGPKPSLPPAIFAWALGAFWNWKYPRSSTVSAREIAHAEGSPGVVFRLDEDSTLFYLDALGNLTGGTWRFEDTPLVRQVVLDGPPKRLDSLLASHYQTASPL